MQSGVVAMKYLQPMQGVPGRGSWGQCAHAVEDGPTDGGPSHSLTGRPALATTLQSVIDYHKSTEINSVCTGLTVEHPGSVHRIFIQLICDHDSSMSVD